MPDWFHDGTFWEKIYRFMFSEQRFETSTGDVEGLIRISGVREGSVLDLGCGPGRHSIPLAARGFRVSGVDSSAFLLDRAAERAHAEEQAIEWIRQDMREFVRPDSFDLAVLLGSSFGYFDEADDDVAVLRNVRHSLVPGGVFVMDTVNKPWLVRNITPVRVNEGADGAVLIDRQEILEHPGGMRILNRQILVEGSVAWHFRVEHELYGSESLSQLLQRAGFREVSFHGGLDGTTYGPDASRLVAVARK